jgi:hypothetical protein
MSLSPEKRIEIELLCGHEDWIKRLQKNLKIVINREVRCCNWKKLKETGSVADIPQSGLTQSFGGCERDYQRKYDCKYHKIHQAHSYRIMGSKITVYDVLFKAKLNAYLLQLLYHLSEDDTDRSFEK